MEIDPVKGSQRAVSEEKNPRSTDGPPARRTLPASLSAGVVRSHVPQTERNRHDVESGYPETAGPNHLPRPTPRFHGGAPRLSIGAQKSAPTTRAAGICLLSSWARTPLPVAISRMAAGAQLFTLAPTFARHSESQPRLKRLFARSYRCAIRANKCRIVFGSFCVKTDSMPGTAHERTRTSTGFPIRS